MAPSFTNAISIPQKVDICHDGETVESHMYNHFDWECLDWSGTGRFKWCEQRGWTPKNGSHSNDYAGACEEVCDGVDNDGDDAIDE
ncbi:hypothetical protein KA013_03635 [Patescibacteria group bacterium]|nr:hypothetical protein [Patescibacteria group bacterium]